MSIECVDFQNFIMDAAARLKAIRKELGLTQESFAESIGLKRDNITSLELRKVKITTLHALAIEHVHNVNKEWLLDGKGEVFLQKSNLTTTSQSGSKVIKVVTEHQDLVKKFKNPDKAKEFNEYLINIEENDSEGYDELYSKAKTIHQTINRLKSKDKSLKKSKAGLPKPKKANGD